MDKEEKKQNLNFKVLANMDQDDGLFENLFQSLFLSVIFGLFVMLLWNAILPELFKFPEINYLQSVGLIVLARLIFGGIAFRYDYKKSKKSYRNKEKLMRLSQINNLSDWKDYDKYWDEEGKQNFENYKNRKMNTNSKEDKNNI